MKILILSNNTIGLIKFRGELISTLSKKGYKVFVCVPESPYTRDLRKLGCKVKIVDFDRRGRNLLDEIKLLTDFFVIIRCLKPGVVLTYTIKPNIYGGLVCRFKRIPYISNITGLGTEIGHDSIFSKALLGLYRFSINRAKKVFVQNVSIKEYLKGKSRKRGRNYELLPGSGVNLEVNHFIDYPKDDGVCRFLYIGRVMKDKGISEYLNAAEEIKRRYHKTVFDIYGDMDEPEFEHRILTLQNKGVVNYHPFQEDIREVIGDHEAIVHPSYHEGLSNALLEGAAIGRPVIASRIPGCQETFEEEKTGLGFRCKDSKDLIRALEKFIKLPYREKKEMGINARKKMEKEFSRDIVINKYLDELTKVENEK